MSTIQTRNKMDEKIHKNLFYFVANVQLYYLTVQNRLKYRQCQTSDMLTKQMQFLLMNIANMNSETSTIDC